jgi:RecB family exonuclease
VERAAREVLAAPRRWSPALIELECARLLALLHEFIAAELTRPPFRVVATEARIAADIAGLGLRLFVDRIDELEDGRRLVIDYKTGGVTPRAWHGDRPDDPQLPLYAVVTSPPPAAVAFSFLRADGCSYQGAGEAPAPLPDLEVSADWQAQLREWRGVVERLAGEFAAGAAAVNPSARRVCRYCHLHALCRIEEIDGPSAEDEDAA